MTDLYIFTYEALFYPDDAVTPRARPGVDPWFNHLRNGTIKGSAAVLWNLPQVGRRYALKAAGLPQSAYGGYMHEARAEENRDNLAEKLGISPAFIFQSFNWFNYADMRVPTGETAVPKERENDPRWSVEWRFPEPGMLLAALKAAGVAPAAALFIFNSQNEYGAAFRTFTPGIFSPHFFFGWPNHQKQIKQRRVKRRPLDSWNNET